MKGAAHNCRFMSFFGSWEHCKALILAQAGFIFLLTAIIAPDKDGK